MTDLWRPLDEQGRVFRSHYRADLAVSNSYLVHLDDSRWLVYSPGRALAEPTAEWLGRDAKVIILAPNRVHLSGVTAWKDAFPDAVVVATERTARRLEKRHSVTEVAGPSTLVDALPESVQCHEVPDSKFGEIWLSVETEDRVFWLVCDGVMNLESLSPKRLTRWVQWLYGLRTGLWITPIFRAGVDKTAFRSWAEARWSDTARIVLLPCHGEPFDQDSGSDRLRELLARRCS